MPVSPPLEYISLLQALSLELAPSSQSEMPAIQALKGGRNNRLWRLQTHTGPVLLKSYYPDHRPRLQTEWDFLQHAQGLGLKSVPRPLACSVEARLAVYSWETGEPLSETNLLQTHVQQYLGFLKLLNPPDQNPLNFAPASDSCFSWSEHLLSLEKRVNRLSAAPFNAPEVTDLFRGELLPIWQELKEKLASWLDAKQTFAAADLWLSPSDVGFHNTLLRPNGKLVFLDFEYAGKDQRLKTHADFLTSVGVPLPLAALNWVEADLREQGARLEQLLQFRQLLPLHQLKWCCILMGLFSPTAAHRRDFAGSHARLLREAQIDRIRSALARTRHWQNLAHELA
ncbi:MAG: phosphotransferase [Candidatus Sericytochromatia bacterium]|nr:phosphotransferase [Candidatus Sericytochromatia bacterium]